MILRLAVITLLKIIQSSLINGDQMNFVSAVLKLMSVIIKLLNKILKILHLLRNRFEASLKFRKLL